MITDFVQLTTLLQFVKNGVTHESTGSGTVVRSIPVAGRKSSKKIVTIGTGDTVVSLSDIGTIGWVVFDNLGVTTRQSDGIPFPPTPGTPVITNVVIATPDISSVVNIGTAGATTVTYKVQAVMANGDLSPPSAAASTTTSNSTLTSSNYNQISWDAILNAVSYNVYRTVAPTTPSTTGLIGNTAALTLNDQALAGDGTTAPTFTNAATWTYKIVARGLDGSFTVASAAGSTSTGRAILSVNNYNLVKWVPVTAANSYDVYRTVSGGTPDETGKFINIGALVNLFTDVDGIQYAFVNDVGVEGDGTTAPATTPWDSRCEFGSNGVLYDVASFCGDICATRWNSAAIHGKALVNATDVEITIIEQ